MKEIPLEKEIVRAIVIALKAEGYRFIFKTHGGAFQAAGIPDLITIAKGGRFVGLEVKRPGIGRVTALQEAMMRLINVAGGYAVIVRSADETIAAIQAAESGFCVGGSNEAL